MFKRIPIYPFLVGVYSVLTLGAYNISQIEIPVIWRPLAASLLLTGAVFGFSYLLLREWHRVAVVTAIFLLLFFSYGQVHSQFETISIVGIYPFRHSVLLTLWGTLLIASIVWTWHRLKSPENWTPWLNLISALLVLYPTYTIAATGVTQKIAAFRREQSVTTIAATGNTPNIYYIILDGYARHDLLRDKFGYDNSDFINAMKERGFYIAECSQSNYAHTQMSLTSSLNMAYIDDLSVDVEARFDPSSFVKHGAIRSVLEEHGYKTAAVPSGYPWSEWTDADVYYTTEREPVSLNDFEALLVQTTMLEPLWDHVAGSLGTTQYLVERRRFLTRNALEALQTIPQLDGKFFVFVHIIVPHPPYLFGPNGENVVFLPDDISESLERKAYADQARFISSEILEAIDVILTDSDQPPIIIVQGDHGPPPYIVTPRERMQNLSAIYMPEIDGENVLYPSITPVNTFRVVLNEFFDQHLDLLEDHSYFTPKDVWRDSQEIPPSCPTRR